MSFEEKRIAPRIDISHPVKYKDKSAESWKMAFLINQSDTGILLASQNNIETGCTIFVIMDKDTGWEGEPCKLECEVVRVVHQEDDALLKYDLGCIIKNTEPL